MAPGTIRIASALVVLSSVIAAGILMTSAPTVFPDPNPGDPSMLDRRLHGLLASSLILYVVTLLALHQTEIGRPFALMRVGIWTAGVSLGISTVVLLNAVSRGPTTALPTGTAAVSALFPVALLMIAVAAARDAQVPDLVRFTPTVILLVTVLGSAAGFVLMDSTALALNTIAQGVAWAALGIGVAGIVSSDRTASPRVPSGRTRPP